ncbi:MAG: extracellular solute-binding protein, partial [Spirochaetales bacterium]|nr:extracellular solute-binding protein [Spirochaetales bacterium]
MKKNHSIFFTAVLLVLLIITSGCSKQADTSSKDMVDMSVQIFDRGIPGLSITNGFQAQYIKKSMAKKGVNIRFISTPRNTTDEKLNDLMVSQEAPDLCITYSNSLISNYIKLGGLVDLKPYLDKYGSNLKAYLGDNVLKYGEFKGGQYTIPGKRPNTAAFGTFVRKDWLDKMGLKEPQTTDEFYNMLVEMKKQNPGKVENCIPFAFNIDKTSIDWTVHTLVYSFVKKMSEEQFAAKNDYGK